MPPFRFWTRVLTRRRRRRIIGRSGYLGWISAFPFGGAFRPAAAGNQQGRGKCQCEKHANAHEFNSPIKQMDRLRTAAGLGEKARSLS